MSRPNHRLAFQDVAPNERKVILATNVAESSITLKDIVYVLDFCLTKRLEVNSICSCLIVEPAFH